MSLFSKFKNNLQKTSNFLSSNILTSFQNKKVDRETLEELEAVLISADISLDVVEKLINSVRKVKTSDQDITKTVLETLSKEIEIILQPREGSSIEENNNSDELSNDFTSIQPSEKINLLLKEKEINEEVRKKIEIENNQLKDQISEIQKTLFKNQKILKEQEKTIQSFEIDQEEIKFLKLNLEFSEKCRKKRKLFSDKGFEVGTPEYKNCVLNKGIVLNE